MGGKYHLKLNTGERPIANKYREGKMKRTLKRELKVLEIAKREALSTSYQLRRSSLSAPLAVSSCCFKHSAPCAAKRWLEVQDGVRVKIHSMSGRKGPER